MPRNNLFMLIFAFGLANAMIRPIREHVTEFGAVDSLISGFGISFIVWFAVYCSFDLMRKANTNKANQIDWIVAFFTMILLLVPSAFASWVTLSLFAAYCGFHAFRSASIGRNASLIMLAIALRVPVSDICLKLSADALLQFDTIATLSLLGFMGVEAVRQGNIVIGAAGHELLIMTGCASFTNISLALLLWFTIVRTQIRHWHTTLTFYILPLTVAVMGINIARLSMMALSQENYFFYHDGLGADIVNVLILMTALGTAMICITFEKRRLAHAG